MLVEARGEAPWPGPGRRPGLRRTAHPWRPLGALLTAHDRTPLGASITRLLSDRRVLLDSSSRPWVAMLPLELAAAVPLIRPGTAHPDRWPRVDTGPG